MRAVKRAIDFAAGLVLAVVAIPVILVLALVVAARLQQWPFFVQERIGQGGKHFRFPKLRTMPGHAPKYALKGDGQLSQLEIPPFLRFMRASHLDELPQLLLVPIGVMSLVGPRPKMPDSYEAADAVYTSTRTSVPQGCTGLWQVGAHTDLLPSQAPEYDFFYVENWSIALDMWILWRTVLQFFGAEGVELQDMPAWAGGDLERVSHPLGQLSQLSTRESSTDEPSLSEVAV